MLVNEIYSQNRIIGILSRVLVGQLKLNQAYHAESGTVVNPIPKATPDQACNSWGSDRTWLASEGTEDSCSYPSSPTLSQDKGSATWLF